LLLAVGRERSEIPGLLELLGQQAQSAAGETLDIYMMYPQAELENYKLQVELLQEKLQRRSVQIFIQLNICSITIKGNLTLLKKLAYSVRSNLGDSLDIKNKLISIPNKCFCATYKCSL